MAVWYQQRPQQASDAKVTLHFNLWHYKPTKAKIKSFLDIGLLLSDYAAVENIFLYIPTKCGPIEDLAPKFDEKIVVGVFNEELYREDGNQYKYIDLSRIIDGQRTSYARIWRLETDEMETEILDDPIGTIIKIKRISIDRAINNINSESQIYFRLRLYLSHIVDNPFIKTITPWDGRLLSGFDRLECVDFRLNELRNLPQPVTRKLRDRGNTVFHIEQIHFLLATDVRAEFVSGHQQFHKSRMLESGMWDEYVGDILPSHMVIYHWKVPLQEAHDTSIRDFNAFLKFRIRESNTWTVVRFIFFAALIGALGSYISGYIPTYQNRSVPLVQDVAHRKCPEHNQN